MRYAVFLTADAARDLEELHDYVVRHDAPGKAEHLLRRSFGDTPLAGLFCAGELGPVQSATFLHGYSTVFGLIRPRRR